MDIQIPVYRCTIRELRPGSRSAAAILRVARRLGLGKVRAVRRSEIYFLRGNIAPGEFELLGRFLFSDPVTQSFEIASCPAAPKLGDQAVEVAYHPGVTDPVAEEILRAAAELGISGLLAAATGQRFEFDCAEGERLENAELETLASKVLANPVVQSFALGAIEASFPSGAKTSSMVESIHLAAMDEAGLAALNLVRRAALDPGELLAIQQYFRKEKRPCTDVEFETIAQTWSEHCFHKTFKALIEVERGEEGGLPPQVDNILRTYLKSATDEIDAPWVVSAFKDNAGIIEFDEDFDISFKVETHNHPSAIEPFGGANTGVGGVIRDVMAVSARPIAVTDVLCFGPSEGRSSAADLWTEHIRNGVVAGVQDYGNKMGIPTVNGGIHYHENYAANPLVYCGCAGIAPKGAFFSAPRVGDRLVCLGGRTGRDGIRGATFSSMTMDGATFDTAGSSVQIGAPIVEKKVAEVLLSARDAGLFTGITDCGAGGLSSAVGEMALELGAEVELQAVRLKYPGLSPWETWLSEAQERMVLAVAPENMETLAALCAANDVEHCDLGSFTGDGRLVVRHGGAKVLDLDCGFLHRGMPRRRLRAAPPVAAKGQGLELGDKNSLCEGPALGVDLPSAASLLPRILSHPAVASKEWAVRRYDHEVQGATRIGPFAGPLQKGPSDAAVLKPLETRGLRAISFSNGFNPRYGEADTYNAAWSALDEAVRNAVASGADPDRIAVVDNFCWGDPLVPGNLWTLLRSAMACREAALAHRTPFISGKDSFNNEFEGPDGSRLSIPPSLLISAMGIVPDLFRAPTTDLKAAGDIVYLVGEFVPETSASVLGETLELKSKGLGPRPSRGAPVLYRALHRAVAAGLVSACHDLSDGGFGVALAEMCMGGGRGARAGLAALGRAAASAAVTSVTAGKADPSAAFLLFGETNGCLLVEVAPEDSSAFEAALAGLPWVIAAEVLAGPMIELRNVDGSVERLELSTLEAAYSGLNAEDDLNGGEA
ncbi:MAG: phosphoribosylformylglycinamidine synthase subunit PurS [Spirochaetes bacterium]|nr:phosphoribosylformylglycinamidine synthase subunit PurS [Spirochaetota bacterium]